MAGSVLVGGVFVLLICDIMDLDEEDRDVSVKSIAIVVYMVDSVEAIVAEPDAIYLLYKANPRSTSLRFPSRTTCAGLARTIKIAYLSHPSCEIFPGEPPLLYADNNSYSSQGNHIYRTNFGILHGRYTEIWSLRHKS